MIGVDRKALARAITTLLLTAVALAVAGLVAWRITR